MRGVMVSRNASSLRNSQRDTRTGIPRFSGPKKYLPPHPSRLFPQPSLKPPSKHPSERPNPPALKSHFLRRNTDYTRPVAPHSHFEGVRATFGSKCLWFFRVASCGLGLASSRVLVGAVLLGYMRFFAGRNRQKRKHLRCVTWRRGSHIHALVIDVAVQETRFRANQCDRNKKTLRCVTPEAPF